MMMMLYGEGVSKIVVLALYNVWTTLAVQVQLSFRIIGIGMAVQTAYYVCQLGRPHDAGHGKYYHNHSFQVIKIIQ